MKFMKYTFWNFKKTRRSAVDCDKAFNVRHDKHTCGVNDIAPKNG